MVKGVAKNGRKQATLGTTVVLVHFVLLGIHATTHSELGVGLSIFQSLFVIIVITLAPVVAAVLLWTSFRRTGAWLLLISMLASLVFGFSYHFAIPGSDNAFTMPASQWGLLFQITTVLLGVMEGVGTAVAVWMLNIHSKVMSGGKYTDSSIGCG
jgi:hypothetical protein